MIEQEKARSWLPENALAEGALPELIGELAASWSSKWFASAGLRLLDDRLGRGEGNDGSAAGEWLLLGDALALAIAPSARTAIAGLVLDGPVGEVQLKPADRKVIDRISAAAIDDFGRRAADLFRVAGEWRPGASLPAGLAPRVRCCRMGLAGEALVTLYIDEAVAAELRRRSARARPRAVPLRPIQAGLGSQSVEVAALLGRCTLALPELAELGAGDILLLDRDPTGEIDLIVDGRIVPGGCALDREADTYRLRLSAEGPGK